MPAITVRGVTLLPPRDTAPTNFKILVPVMANDLSNTAAAGATGDVVELRLDALSILNAPNVQNVLCAARAAIGQGVPLLATIRTKKEGGLADLTDAAYGELGTAICHSGLADLLDVVLEVNAENLLAAGKAADLAYTLDHVLTLFGIQHQVNVSTIADGHIVEVPVEAHAVADEHIHEFIAGNSLVVGGSVADGGTKQQAVLFHDVHSVHNALEHAFAAAAVGGIIQALNGQEESHVADFLDFLAESIVDQSTIGEGKELTVRIFLTDTNQVFLRTKGSPPV